VSGEDGRDCGKASGRRLIARRQGAPHRTCNFALVLPSFLSKECHGFTLSFQALRLDIAKCSYTEAIIQHALNMHASMAGTMSVQATPLLPATASTDFGHNDSLLQLPASGSVGYTPT